MTRGKKKVLCKTILAENKGLQSVTTRSRANNAIEDHTDKLRDSDTDDELSVVDGSGDGLAGAKNCQVTLVTYYHLIERQKSHNFAEKETSVIYSEL
jgi:hypothetical protein